MNIDTPRRQEPFRRFLGESLPTFDREPRAPIIGEEPKRKKLIRVLEAEFGKKYQLFSRFENLDVIGALDKGIHQHTLNKLIITPSNKKADIGFRSFVITNTERFNLVSNWLSLGNTLILEEL